MDQAAMIREGMPVIGPGGGALGTVERVDADGFDANGRHYDRIVVARVADGRVYVRGTGIAEGAIVAEAGAGVAESSRGAGRDLGAMEEETIRVPVVEERLAVGTREVNLGEVAIHKTVEVEEQTIPVTLTREEVYIEERTVAERPATGDDLFREATIRVRLRGEEAVVAKETVVTGEVVIEKDAVAEERRIADTVRKLRVDVDEHYQRERAGFEQAHAAGAGGTGRAFAQAEPNYRTGFDAGYDERYSGREFEEIEPEIRRDYSTRGVEGDRWAELRAEIRAGWEKARKR